MRRIAGAALVLVLAAGAGCTDDPEPRFEDPTGSPSASDSTSPAADEKEPWEERSKAGAVAFAKHWVGILNEVQVSGDVRALRQASTRECVSCQDLADQLESLYENGGRIETDGWRVLLVGPPPESITTTAQVTLRVMRSPQRVFEGGGAPKKFKGDRTTFSAGLIWQDGHWLMNELVRFT